VDDVKKMLGYLILIGISKNKNEKHVKAVSESYRHAAVRHQMSGMHCQHLVSVREISVDADNDNGGDGIFIHAIEA